MRSLIIATLVLAAAGCATSAVAGRLVSDLTAAFGPPRGGGGDGVYIWTYPHRITRDGTRVDYQCTLTARASGGVVQTATFTGDASACEAMQGRLKTAGR